jgi:hypothetical protein
MKRLYLAAALSVTGCFLGDPQPPQFVAVNEAAFPVVFKLGNDRGLIVPATTAAVFETGEADRVTVFTEECQQLGELVLSGKESERATLSASGTFRSGIDRTVDQWLWPNQLVRSRCGLPSQTVSPAVPPDRPDPRN